MVFTIKTRRFDGVVVLEASGPLVRGDAVGVLGDTTRRHLHDGDRALVLDLAGVSLMDSAGLGQVMETYTSARNAGGRAVLLNPPARAMQVLLIAKLVTVFDVYDDEAAAVEALAEYVVDDRDSIAVECAEMR